MKNKINFESYFSKKVKRDENLKFTILLGSGFHRSYNDNHTVLNNWDVLLKSISPNFKSSGNYILDFEKIILEQVSDLNAQKQENILIKSIASKIKDAEKRAIKNEISNYPSFIFNPNYVSDVISLNVDCIAEELCKILFNAKLKKSGYVKFHNTLGKDALLHQTTKYKILEFPSGSRITFWYPHGSIIKPSGIILGARKYSQHVGCIEHLRRYSKSEDRKDQEKDTWYDKLTHKPILILGASISSDEWDIWSAFVNRERNFFKNSNKEYRKPIFQMRSEQCKNKCDETTNQKWFEPLFDERLDFNLQWTKLKKLFENEK
jgi:hypothetical protein